MIVITTLEPAAWKEALNQLRTFCHDNSTIYTARVVKAISLLEGGKLMSSFNACIASHEVPDEPAPCGFTGIVRFKEDPYRDSSDALDALKSLLFSALLGRDDKAIGVLVAKLHAIVNSRGKGD